MTDGPRSLTGVTDPGNPLIASLARAVEAAPDDVTLRVHLAELLLGDGRQDAAVATAPRPQRDPGDAPLAS